MPTEIRGAMSGCRVHPGTKTLNYIQRHVIHSHRNSNHGTLHALQSIRQMRPLL